MVTALVSRSMKWGVITQQIITVRRVAALPKGTDMMLSTLPHRGGTISSQMEEQRFRQCRWQSHDLQPMRNLLRVV